MSREFKFRAWDKGRKEFLSAGQILLAINSKRYPKSTDFYLDVCNEKYKNMWRDRFEIQQFIGVPDKNGKEIYEGDIVKLPAWMTNHGDYAVCKYTDLSSDTYPIIGFAFFDLKGNLVDSDEWDEYEVIGNVYENADLLKEVGNE